MNTADTEKGKRDLMPTRINLLIISSLLYVFTFNAPALADEYHYTNILIGERPAGLAGAYVAISDDPSGLYYNPAGIVYAAGKKISASANAYYTTTKSYKNALGSSNWNRNSSSLLPNFFGIIQPVGKGMLGLSYAVPDSIIEDQDESFDNITGTISRFTINFNKQDTTYLFGPSYAQEIKEGLSIGATLYFHYRRKKVINIQHILYTDNSTYLSNVVDEREELGLRPMLGVMWSPPNLKYSFGMTISRTFVYDETIFIQTITKAQASATATFSKTTFNIKRQYPWKINIGGAYFPSDSLLFSGDVSYYTSVSDDFGNRVSVINIALGTEYYLSSTLALKGGFYTNVANSEKINAGDSGKDENIDLYGISASSTIFTRSTSLTFGMVYGFGSGQAQVNSADSTAIQSVSATSLLIYIGTSYAF